MAVNLFGKDMDRWAYKNGVTMDYSRPGTPTDNPFIESFNGSFRDECLNAHWFLPLEDAREKISAWQQEYNSYRPHSSLNGLTPDEFIAKGLARGWELYKRGLPAAPLSGSTTSSAQAQIPAALSEFIAPKEGRKTRILTRCSSSALSNISGRRSTA